MYSLKSNTLVTEVDGNVIILDVNKSEYFTLDSIASTIFSLIKEGKDIDYISEVITEEYDVSIAQVKKDIKDFCDKLVKDGLLLKQ